MNDNVSHVAVNAKFSLVKELEEDEESFYKFVSNTTTSSSNLPATLDTFVLDRHPLMAGKVSPEIEKFQKELDIDKKLGLQAQAEGTAKEALVADINELTKSNNYIQVSRSILEGLFHITSLRMLCLLTNIQSFVKGLFPNCLTPSIMSAATLVAIPLLMFFSAKIFSGSTSWLNYSLCIGVCLAWMGLIVFGIFSVKQWVAFKMAWDSINVNLVSQSLSTVAIKIPMGAKLKVLEAKETGIFEDFVYAYPMFSINRKEIEVRKYIPKINIDPAILGVTKDQRMYMIVYWDVKKDIAHVLQQVKDFRKFKVTA
jgi:hypothetical protein